MISIISRGQALGYTISLPREDRYLTTKATLMSQMAMTLGGRAAADDRDLVDLVGLVEMMADERVAHLVVGGDLPLLLREQPGLLLGTGDHTHDPFLEFLLLDQLLAAARREQRRLVDEV